MVKLHQEGTIHNLYGQSFPVVLDLEASDDGHLSGFVNFHGNVRPDGFPVGKKFSIIIDDPRASIVQEFLHLTIQFVHAQTAQVKGYINNSRAQFQNVNTVADVQVELDYRFAKMAIEAAKVSTAEDDKPRPKVGAVAVKHGQLLGSACRTAVDENGKTNGQHAEFRLTSALSGADLDGATVYTTLEPCLNRNEPKVSCVDRLISVKVARVVIGALDPDHRGNGLRKLAYSPTIEIGFFHPSLRTEARELISEWKNFSEQQQKSVEDPPQVILDYAPFVTDTPRMRQGSWIVRNTGQKAAMNVLVESFTIGRHTVICDPVDRLLPSDTAKVTCEVRSGDDIRKPCLLELEALFQVELEDGNIDRQAQFPLTIRYGDLTGRGYMVQYSLSYRIGINQVLAEFKKLEPVG
jgi:pyrimidine deaminase RibD-like protein